MLSRLAAIKAEKKDEDYVPELPPFPDAAGYVLDYLFDVGPTVAVGMGAGPVTHVELRAWQLNLGIRLKPWEVQLVRRLSGEYLAQWVRSSKLDCPAPWEFHAMPDVAAVATALADAIREMVRS